MPDRRYLGAATDPVRRRPDGVGPGSPNGDLAKGPGSTVSPRTCRASPPSSSRIPPRPAAFHSTTTPPVDLDECVGAPGEQRSRRSRHRCRELSLSAIPRTHLDRPHRPGWAPGPRQRPSQIVAHGALQPASAAGPSLTVRVRLNLGPGLPLYKDVRPFGFRSLDTARHGQPPSCTPCTVPVVVVVTGTAQKEAWDLRILPPVEEVRPGLWSIPVPIPDNPLRYVLVYALELDGGGVAMIDAGWNTEEAWAALSTVWRAQAAASPTSRR